MTTQVLSTLRKQFKRSPLISLTLATLLVLSLGIGIALSSQQTSASRTGLTRAMQAEVDRYTGLAAQYQARGRVVQAEIGRLNGQAQAYFQQQRVLQAQSERLNAQAEAFHRQRAIQAETDRLNAQAKAYLASQGMSKRSLEAWAARYTAYAAEVSPEIEGTWLAKVTIPDGPPPFPSLLTYARGGALIVTDSSVPPALGNVYQGSWTKTGPHEFAFTFLGFQYDGAGVLTNYIRAHETIQLEPGGNVYNGVTSIEILDLDQNVIATSSSTTHATRFNAQ